MDLPSLDVGSALGGRVPADDATVAAAVVIEVIAFSPDRVTLEADRAATIAVDNRDDLPHTFTVAELGLHVEIPPGQTRHVTVHAPAGRYRFECEVAGHGGYRSGTLVVEGAGSESHLYLEACDIGWRTDDQAGPMVDLTAEPGQLIELVNTGSAPHNLQVEGLGISQDMPVDFRGTVQIPADAAPGTCSFVRNVPGHAPVGMVGTITVIADDATAA